MVSETLNKISLAFLVAENTGTPSSQAVLGFCADGHQGHGQAPRETVPHFPFSSPFHQSSSAFPVNVILGEN